MIIPIFAALTLAWGLLAILWAIVQRLRGPKVIYTPKKDSSELTESIKSGYTPTLGLELNEIFPDPITSADIDRLLVAREKLFPIDFSKYLYLDNQTDLSPTEFKAKALRLYVEMAFLRTYFLENSSRLWPNKNESLWIYHAPKPLRKLNPDYYAQLMNDIEQKKRASAA